MGPPCASRSIDFRLAFRFLSAIARNEQRIFFPRLHSQGSPQECLFGALCILVITDTFEPKTSLNIGTPAKIQYYFVTAYDSANLMPEGSPPPPPTPEGLRFGSPQ